MFTFRRIWSQCSNNRSRKNLWRNRQSCSRSGRSIMNALA